MLSRLPRKLALGVFGLGAVVAGYLCLQASQTLGALQASDGRAPASVPGHGGGGGGHGAPAEVHAATPNSAPPLITMEELVSNLKTSPTGGSHTVWMKLELELFGEDVRSVVEQRQGGIRDAILQVAREQDQEQLNTLSGKLYFKEQMVTRINGFLKKAVVRDIHFSDFLLQ